ncbi:hypothetical protein N7524_000106 [Penicillium chrysogenum]|nr:hypothetical protein N7524_000106 [Penicillium chrysogenum]
MEIGGRSFNFKRIPSLVKDGRLDIKTVDQAVSQLLRAKFEMRLFENPFHAAPQDQWPSLLRTDEASDLVRTIDRELIVPLGNHSTLPLKKTNKIAIIGPMAHGYMNYGDYVFKRSQNRGVTPLNGIQRFPQAIQATKDADVAVVVLLLSRVPAQVGSQDRHVDVNSLNLVRAISDTGKPTVVVFSSGKPITEPWIANSTAAFVQPFYPSEQGGNALADVLFGQLQSLWSTICHAIEDSGHVDANGTIVFGHQYAAAMVSLRIHVDVTNTSPVDGTEVVQLYIVDTITSVDAPNRKLKAFKKLYIKAEETESNCQPEYYQIFLSFSVLGGVSASTLFAPPLAAVGHWFNVRRGWATGVACTAGGVGGCIFPLIILFAAPRIGFAWAIRIIALKAGPSLDFKALRDIKYASATLSVFLVEFAVFIPITYITSYTLHAGFDEQMSYAVLVFLNLGAVFGRFLPGLVADRLGRFNVMIMSSFICSLFTLTLWLSADLVEPHSLGMVISYAVLFGFWSGTAISLAPVCISQVCEIQDYGKRVGTTWTIVSVGTLIAIPIAGAIQQHNNGEYYGLIVFGGILYISSTIAFIVSRGICKGWALKIKF